MPHARRRREGADDSGSLTEGPTRLCGLLLAGTLGCGRDGAAEARQAGGERVDARALPQTLVLSAEETPRRTEHAATFAGEEALNKPLDSSERSPEVLAGFVDARVEEFQGDPDLFFGSFAALYDGAASARRAYDVLVHAVSTWGYKPQPRRGGDQVRGALHGTLHPDGT